MGSQDRAVQVVAVVGACGPERQSYAVTRAREQGAVLLQAERVEREDAAVESALRLLQLVPSTTELVVEYPLASAITDVIGSLTEVDLHQHARLTEVICVVDVAHLLGDLFRDEYVVLDVDQRWTHPGELAYVCRAEVLVKQIEYASTVMMVNWSSVSTGELDMLSALVSHLSPQAQVRLAGETSSASPSAAGSGYSGEEARAGWTCLLNENFHPSRRHDRVSAVRYEQLRPFHPGRLKDLLDTRVESAEFGRVVRSAGFARLATRPQATAQWEHVGQFISLAPLEHEIQESTELLAIGQDLAFIGLDLDGVALTSALDDAALSDAELTAGPENWRTFPDPFPSWQSVPEHEE